MWGACLIPRRPIESAGIEAAQLRAWLATDVAWTEDLRETSDATADLPDQSLPDPTPPVDENELGAAAASTALPADKLPMASIPKQHAFGFFAFVTCALSAILISVHPSTESSPAATI